MKIDYVVCTTDIQGKMHGQNNSKVVGYIISSSEVSSVIGISEVYASTYVPKIIEAIVSQIKKSLTQDDPKEAVKFLKNLKIPFSNRNGIVQSVIGCMINSLIDLDCKILGVPLVKYLGNDLGKNTDLKVYASGGTVVMTDQEIRKELSKVEDSGYDGYKIRAGLLDWEKDSKRVRAIFKTQLDTMIDLISGTRPSPYEPKDFEYIMDDLVQNDIFWIEEPIDPDDYEGMSFLQEKYQVNFAGGEAYTGFFEFKNFIRYANLNFIQIDCSYSGDFYTCEKISKLSKSLNKGIATHVWGSSVTKAANFHMANAFGFDYFEDPLIQTSIDNIFDEELSYPFGYKDILDKPGIGLCFNIEDFKNFDFVEGTEYSW